MYASLIFFIFHLYSNENAAQLHPLSQDVLRCIIRILPHCYSHDKDCYEIFKTSSYLSRTCKAYKNCFYDVLKYEIGVSKEILSSFNFFIISNYYLSTKVLIFFAHQHQLQETQQEKEVYQKCFDVLWSCSSELRDQRMAGLLGHNNKSLFERDRMKVYRGEFLTYDEQCKAFEYCIKNKEEYLAKQIFNANSEIMKEKAIDLLQEMNYYLSLGMLDFLLKNSADSNNVQSYGKLVADYVRDYRNSPREEILERIKFFLRKGACFSEGLNPLNISYHDYQGLIDFDKYAPLINLLLQSNYYSQTDKCKLLNTAISVLNQQKLQSLAKRQIDYLTGYVPIEEFGICNLVKYGGKNELVKEKIAKNGNSFTLEQQKNLITVAWDYNNTEILQFLLQQQKYPIPSELLLGSCLKGNIEIVDILLKNGADIRENQSVYIAYKRYIVTCLGAASKSGNVKLVKCLVDTWKMNPNDCVKHESLIHFFNSLQRYKPSKSARYSDIFQYLLQKGAFCSLASIEGIQNNQEIKAIVKKYMPFKAWFGSKPILLKFLIVLPFLFGLTSDWYNDVTPLGMILGGITSFFLGTWIYEF